MAAGMKNVQPRSSLRINIMVLRTLGLWFPEEKTSGWKRKLYVLYAIATQGSLFYLYTLSEAIFIVKSFGDIERMTDASFLFLTHMAQVGKNYFFYRNSMKIVAFLEELESEVFKPKNREHEKILMWAMTRAYWDSLILHTMALITCSLWALFPFIEQTEGSIRLPLTAWYPVDSVASPNFQLIFFYQIFAVVLDAFTNISMDTIMTGILVHICAQLDMLKESLSNLKSTAELNIERDLLQDELEKEMIKLCSECVQRHEAIIGYVVEYEDIFSMCFLYQFAASVVIICLTLFKISLVPSIFSVQFASLVMYQACIVFELLLYCWHGNEMMLKSEAVGDAAYNSEWYECSPKFSKNIILIMVRSRRPIKATAGNFFSLSLSTFTAILKSSWSYFAVLNNMHDDVD